LIDNLKHNALSLMLKLVVTSGGHEATVFREQRRPAREILKPAWNVYYLQSPGTGS
jgi:hypothetical protein